VSERPTTARAAPTQLPGGATSLERVGRIVALDAEPVRRNLLITQCYHDLSAGLARRLGAENANWCTFATWASRTAGRFIRDEEVPAAFREVLVGSPRLTAAVARANRALGWIHADARIRHDDVFATSRRIVHEVGELITAGNLAVFSELGPVFSRTIDALEEDTDGAAVERVAATLSEGESDQGGQTMLRRALTGYAAARRTEDPHQKAELMLLANARIGLHEQIRLQPYIAGSIDAPIRLALFEPVDDVAACLPRGTRLLSKGLMRAAVLGAANEAKRHWEELCTRELMTLALPGETLMLGRALRAPAGQPLYPPLLDPVDDPEALRFLEEHGALRPDRTGSGAVNWTRLADRMRYIIDLFRSRQLYRPLQGPPFTAEQRRQLAAGVPVTGPL
jgi:hypothetical protein